MLFGNADNENKAKGILSQSEAVEKENKQNKRIIDYISTTDEIKELTSEEYQELKKIAQSEVMEKVDPNLLGKYRDKEAKEAIKRQVIQTIQRAHPNIPYKNVVLIADQMSTEISGYGPLDKYLNDTDITEIMVEMGGTITIEKDGTLYETGDKFVSQDDLMLVIERILMPIGRKLDYANPTVNARLPDGSRVAATHARVAVDGHELTIRKFKPDVTIEDLIRYGALNEKIKNALIKCVKARLSIVISGGTGSGKSTWMNSMSRFIDPTLSIITIEDPCELQFKHPHVRRWEAQPPNIEGKGEVTIGHLVKHALRNRPDIIIVGEVRGNECYDFARANATGHKGSMTTLHADSEEEAGDTLVGLTTSAGVFDQRMAASYIAKGVDLIVQLQRMPDRSRKLVGISEVIGSNNGEIITRRLIEFVTHRYDGKKVIGDWRVVNEDSTIANKLKDAGIEWNGWL